MSSRPGRTVFRTAPNRSARVLLVEDSPSDAALVAAALEFSPVATDVAVVTDGESALAYLKAEPPFLYASKPDLIILDLNLPRMDGRELLRDVKSDPELSKTPVVVMTSSSAPLDVLEAYRCHVNSYVCKPWGMDDLISTVGRIVDYWMVTAVLPSEDG